MPDSALLDRPAANDDFAVAADPIKALVGKMAPLSNVQINKLEDEIDFYAFTGLVGDLMSELLCTAPTVGDCSNPAIRNPGFDGKSGKDWQRAS